MPATSTVDIMQDDIAVSIARALAVANKRARALGIDVLHCLITVTQRPSNGDTFWRINYGPKDYVARRGGDLIIEIDQSNASIIQEQWGQ